MMHKAVIVLAPPAFCKSVLFRALRSAVDSTAVDTDLGINVIDADNIIPLPDALKQASVESRTSVIENICKIANRTVIFTSNPILAKTLSDAAVRDYVAESRERLVVRGIAITPCPFVYEYDAVNTAYIRDSLRSRALSSIERMTPAITGHINVQSGADHDRQVASIEFSALSEASAWMSLMRSFIAKLHQMAAVEGASNAVTWITQSLFSDKPGSTPINPDDITTLRLNDKGSQASSFLCIALMLHLIRVNLIAGDARARFYQPRRVDIHLNGIPSWAADAVAALTIREAERTLCGFGPVKRVSDLHSAVEEKVMQLVSAYSSGCLDRAYDYWQATLVRVTPHIIHPSTIKD